MTARVEISAPGELLPWDTEFFQCRLGRVLGDTLDDQRAFAVDDWAQSEQIKGLYFLARVDCPSTLQIANRHGFELVDIRVTFEHPVLNARETDSAQLWSEVVIRAARPEDLPGLQAIARTAHTDTRFFTDHHFPRPLAEKLYSTWITLDCQGRAQKVFVAVSPADLPLGYISCHLDVADNAGQIGLVGVSQAARGRGLGRQLVLTALNWLAARAAQKVKVVTQGKNLPAQRLYQRCGFVTRDLQLWHHKWYPLSLNHHA